MSRNSNNVKLDQKWHDSLVPLLVSEMAYFIPDKEHYKEQKALFFSGEIRNPERKYHLLDYIDLEKRTRDLHDFIDEVATEKDELVGTAYNRVANEQIKKVRLLTASKNKDDFLFSEISGELYGIPTFEAYRIVMKWFDWYRVRSSVFMKMMKPHYSSAEVQELFTRDLKRRNLVDWDAQVSEGEARAIMSVSHDKKRINIPSDDFLNVRATPLSKKRLAGLRRHEVGIHVMRRINGEKSPLLLLSTGLAGYMKAEEGIGVRSELQIGTGDKLSWNSRYLAIALCYGMDGPLRDFRDVYEELLKHIASVRSDAVEESEVRRSGASLMNSDIAFQICYRIFRGTTGNTPGACYSRDSIYIGGLLHVLNALKEHPEEKVRLLKGKYDVGNKYHRELMNHLGL